MGRAVRVNQFRGGINKVDPISLPEFNAQYAENCDFRDGKLVPYDGQTTDHAPTKAGTILTIYRFNPTAGDDASGKFFHWADDVDVIKGPVPADTVEMTYWTGDGDPKFTDNTIALSGVSTDYPNNEFLLGIPEISGAGSYAVSGTPPTEESQNSTRTYAVTYVGSRGEEGPPALSAEVELGPDEQVDITAIPTAPAGNYDITHKRIYRTATGASSTRYFLVTEITVATTSYSDTLADSALGAELVSNLYFPPPTAAHSLGLASNGIMYMCKDNRLALSEPYLPYAYNPLNEKTTDYPIVGAGNYNSSIVVLTERKPWITQGNDPRSMLLMPIETGHGCVSKRSIASSDKGVVYASDFGLMLIGPGGMINISDRYMTRKQWLDYVPKNTHGVIFNDKYFCFYDDGATTGLIIFDLTEPENGVTYSSVYATAAYTDELSGRLFLQVGSNIVVWDDSGSPLTMIWDSRDYYVQDRTQYTAARVIADSYSSLAFKFYVDGALVHTESVSDNKAFRLTPAVPYERVRFRIEGTDSVAHVEFGQTVSDIG